MNFTIKNEEIIELTDEGKNALENSGVLYIFVLYYQ